MSIEAEPLSHEEKVEEYLKDISIYTRYMAAMIKEAYRSELEFDDIRKLEDCEDGTES